MWDMFVEVHTIFGKPDKVLVKPSIRLLENAPERYETNDCSKDKGGEVSSRIQKSRHFEDGVIMARWRAQT